VIPDEQGGSVRSHPRSRRTERLQATRTYATVIALILVTFVFAAVAPDAAWSSTVLLLLQGAALAGALWTAGFGRAQAAISYLLVVAAVLAGIAELIWDTHAVNGAVGLLSGVLILATVVVIARGVVAEEEVNDQSVIGAICIYLLIGLFFFFVYSAIAVLGSDFLFAQGTDGTRPLRLYYSFITLTTVGYGDYTPAGDLAHTVAIVEALLGQIYLVTVVAVIVSRLGRLRKR
jgi:hypothetical protein